MTSVDIIRARIQYLKADPRFPTEAEKLLEELDVIENRLTAAYNEKKAIEKSTEKDLVRVSYEIFDAIEDLSSKSKEKSSGSLRSMLRNKSVNTKVGEVKKRVRDLLANLGKKGEKTPRQESTDSGGSKEKPEAGEYVGDVLQKVRDQLKNMSKESSSVVCICGENGMGKTTLAKKLFDEEQAGKCNFEVFAWVSINNNFQIKRVLQEVLQQVGLPQPRPQEVVDMNQIELIGYIFGVLEKNKYMLVLDDIRSADDWQSIRLALPNHNTSAIIITTSSTQVAKEAATTPSHFHNISGLTETEIRQILMEGSDPPARAETEKVMKAIYDISGGSPLLATILGKSLRTEYAAANEQLVDELQSYKTQKGEPEVLEVCYRRLAPELKPCLLYLGLFPQGQDIEVEKLYLLLAAENLISPNESEIFLKFTRDVLEKLARRKLVEVQEDIVLTSGIYESCRLHERVWTFLKLRGESEEFLEIVDLRKSSHEVSAEIYIRILAIYLSKDRDGNSIQFKSQDTVKKIGSLLIFDSAFESAEGKSGWPSEINDLKEFICLRVLGFDGVDFSARNVPKGMDKLVLLRYLSFRGCRLEEFPSYVSKLTHLETLDLLVRADCKKMILPNNIFKNMKRLLHLYLPREYGSDGKSKLQVQGLEKLVILVNFDTEAFDLEGLSQLNSLNNTLKILTIISKEHENLKAVIQHFVAIKEGTSTRTLQQLSVDMRDFDRYSRDSVDNFKKLLECEVVHSIHVEGAIGDLTVEGNPAPKLAEMVLNSCEIEHDPMSVLGRFQNLRSLVLSNDAFLGTHILISAQSNFPTLKSLKLHNLQYLKRFTIQDGALPKLTTLEIHRCRRLEETSIPKQVRDRLPLSAKLNLPHLDHDQVPGTSRVHGKK